MFKISEFRIQILTRSNQYELQIVSTNVRADHFTCFDEVLALQHHATHCCVFGCAVLVSNCSAVSTAPDDAHDTTSTLGRGTAPYSTDMNAATIVCCTCAVSAVTPQSRSEVSSTPCRPQGRMGSTYRHSGAMLSAKPCMVTCRETLMPTLPSLCVASVHTPRLVGTLRKHVSTQSGHIQQPRNNTHPP